jgi:uncharacterized protein
MLELRPGCERCDKDLPPDSTEACICSFECTFCASCADGALGGICPNCGGELLPRPRRPANELANNPPSSKRVYRPAGH